MKSNNLTRPKSAQNKSSHPLRLSCFDNSDWDIEDDLTSESKVNHVYDSSRILKIRNSLVLSKGSPKRGFNEEYSPPLSPFKSDGAQRGASFQMKLWKLNQINKPHWAERVRSSKWVKRQWSIYRKPSTEILLDLQKQLADLQLTEFIQSEDKASPPKLFFCEKNFLK